MSNKLSSNLIGITLAAGLAFASASSPVRAQGQLTFVSPEAALEQGIGAYRAGFYQIALPALSFAAERKLLLAQYHLARLLADNQSALTDHARAYGLYLGIIEENASRIDLDDEERAPYVGRSLTALARYYLRGLPDIGLQPNAQRAAEFLEEAATFFRDPDSQFELAKLHLKGEGVPEDHRKALYWLSKLSQEGHVGAQAFFADLLWTGKVVARDEARAYALITVAVENAPPHERIWIEDIYQRIFCGAPPGIRQRADGLVASYRQNFGPRSQADGVGGVAASEVGPTRACSNGEPLPNPQREGRVRGGPSNHADGSRLMPQPAQANTFGGRGQ